MQFGLKPIRFLNRTTSIICQNENGPCPLLALANALILQGRFSFHTDRKFISLDNLIEIVANNYIESNQRQTSTNSVAEPDIICHQNQLDEVLCLLPGLARGLDLNVHFTGPSDFEFTKELSLFDSLGIPIYHGWLVDPQDVEASSVVGTQSYNHLMYQLVEFKSLSDQIHGNSNSSHQQTCIDPISSSEDMSTCTNSPLHAQAFSTTKHVSSVPSYPSYSSAATSSVQTTTGSEQELLRKGAIVEHFLLSSASQLTYCGLLALHQCMRENQIAVFFRNNHFSTMFKSKGSLYLLVTDAGYRDEAQVIWEQLDDIDG